MGEKGRASGSWNMIVTLRILLEFFMVLELFNPKQTMSLPICLFRANFKKS
jgi:hypothetical protein